MQVKDFIGADLLAHLYSTTEQVSCYISTLVVVDSTLILPVVSEECKMKRYFEWSGITDGRVC